MSFTVVLCKNKSDRRCLSKEIDVILEVHGNLREATSIIDPTIIIECGLETISAVNYIRIPEFSRMYYVKKVSSVRKNLWELSCHVDVLSSFENEIKANSAIVKRQESKCNLYLNDNSIKTYQDPHIITKEFPSGFSTTETSYVLLVAGRPVDGWFDDSNTDV